MKHSKLACFSAVLCLSAISFVQEAKAKARYFSCDTINGVPTTVANMSNGRKVPMIRWVSNTFDNDGWSPSRRCQTVSARFTEYNNKNQLRYLTTGKMNGVNVICVALNKGDRCSGLVYTLKPGQNPTYTLNKLFGESDLLFSNSGFEPCRSWRPWSTNAKFCLPNTKPIRAR